MKKIILSAVFVFAALGMNANTTVKEYDQDCLLEAWDFGTGWPDEYQATNWYVETYC